MLGNFSTIDTVSSSCSLAQNTSRIVKGYFKLIWHHLPLHMKSKGLVKYRYQIISSTKILRQPSNAYQSPWQHNVCSTWKAIIWHNQHYVRCLIEFLLKWNGICISPDLYFLCEGTGSARLTSSMSTAWCNSHKWLDVVVLEWLQKLFGILNVICKAVTFVIRTSVIQTPLNQEWSINLKSSYTIWTFFSYSSQMF